MPIKALAMPKDAELNKMALDLWDKPGFQDLLDQAEEQGGKQHLFAKVFVESARLGFIMGMTRTIASQTSLNAHDGLGKALEDLRRTLKRLVEDDDVPE